MKRLFRSSICLMLALVTVFSMSTSAFAATTRNAVTGGNANRATSVTVKTDKRTTLKFTQTQGTLSYQNRGTGTSYLNTYGDFFIYVIDKSGGEKAKLYDCSFKKSVTVNLSANKTYDISIVPREKAMTMNKLVSSGKMWYKAAWCKSFEWTKVPTWTVTAYKVISLK